VLTSSAKHWTSKCEQKFFEVNRGSLGTGFRSPADGRGRHAPRIKTPEWKRKLIKQHIESYPTMDSHYCRASSTRKYLDSKLTIKKMYEQFIEYYNENLPTETSGQDQYIPSQKVYRDLFCNEYNLSFFHPKKDQCATCAARDHDTADTDNENTQLFEEHMKQKNLAQDEKRKDKDASCTDDTYIMATFDMQSILQLPTSELGPVYYKRKLVLHNFTIYEGKKPNRGFCYLWLETAGKRGANEIGTCILKYLRSLDEKVKKVTFFSDSCSGQNRNQYICALLLHAVQSLPIDVIEHKFLVPGHTMMECDSMHSAIEYAQKNLSVFSLHEWINVLKTARRHNPYKVELLDHT